MPVILPIKTKGGKLHANYNDDVYTLYPYIENYIQPNRNELTDKQITSMALLLAELHIKGGQAQNVFKNEEKPSWDKVKTLRKIDEICCLIGNSEFDKIAREILNIRKNFIENNSILYEDLNIQSTTLLHGDYHEQNLFFDQNDKILHIFDFEKACFGSPYSELVRTILLVCFNHEYKPNNFRKAKLFLNFYASKIKLDPLILDKAFTAQIIKMFHSTWIEGEHYINKNSKLDKLLLPNLESLKFLEINHTKFMNLINS